MRHDSLIAKILVLISVGSYFAYALYWFVKTIPWIFTISVGAEYYTPATGLSFTNSCSVFMAYLMEYSGFIGLMVRVIGASYALLSCFLILKNEKTSFPLIQNKISKALFLEGCYYLIGNHR